MKDFYEECVCLSRSLMSDSLQPHGLCPSRLRCTWNSAGKNTAVGSLSLPRGLPDPGIELRSSAFQADSLPHELPGKPFYEEWEAIILKYYIHNVWFNSLFMVGMYILELNAFLNTIKENYSIFFKLLSTHTVTSKVQNYRIWIYQD